ncbi:MAG: class I SAM-dependent methyltransferase [Chloroflexi bacterium]|nr:class I SAM-dependent methyltransferase [Chloroflexota bacterium]
MPNRTQHQTNRLSWNEATKAHNSHKGDQASFFRAGGDTLFPEERALLGEIAGKTLLHLQCNCGQDTLSIVARLGAVATGVDISDEAIRFARQLSEQSGIPADYARADIYDFFVANLRKFEIVFSSYGAICWLSDLAEWGRGIASCLQGGGRFVLVDFHPMFSMLDEDWRPRFDYMGGRPVEFESGIGDYVALTGETAETDKLDVGVRDFRNPYPGVEYCWGIAEVVMALVDAGLRLTHFREYDYCNGFRPFPDMSELGNRRYGAPPHLPGNIPLMFSLVAESPA